MIQRKYWPWILSVYSGLLFGFCFMALGHMNTFGTLFGVMSLGYAFGLPLALGVLVMVCSSPELRKSWLHRIFTPWLAVGLSLLASLLFHWEGSICLVFALIVSLPMSSLGGILAGLILNSPRGKKGKALLGIMMAFPGLSSSLESRLGLPQTYNEAHTHIDIQASPERIWSNIEEVRLINEPITGFFYRIGFPKPLEATLSHRGLGGVRTARFDGNLVFIETITDWEQDRLLAFDIKADPKTTPVKTLDEHVVVGGLYFDVLKGTYRLEPLPSGGVRLHLASRFRVSTHFNFYADLIATLLMKDIQGSILDVIKRRCERA